MSFIGCKLEILVAAPALIGAPVTAAAQSAELPFRTVRPSLSLGAGGALVSTEGQRITELTFSYGGRCPRRARWRLGRRRELRVRAVDPLTATTADGLSISRRLGAVGAAMAD